MYFYGCQLLYKMLHSAGQIKTESKQIEKSNICMFREFTNRILFPRQQKAEQHLFIAN